MNDKLKQLSLMAGGSLYPGINSELQQKFAELIIQECCDKFVEMQHQFHPSICAYEIKKHFGVE